MLALPNYTGAGFGPAALSKTCAGALVQLRGAEPQLAHAPTRCGRENLQQALNMGLVNAVVPLEQLELEGVRWAREVLQHSPTAIRCLKAAFNAETDGMAGIQELAGQATHLFYRTEEGQEGRNAFLEKRAPDFSDSPWLP